MNINDKELKELRKRFCKNYDIPIKIYDDPYYTDRIDLYDSIFDTKKNLM